MSDKSAFFLRFARPYVRRRLRREFAEIRVSGLERFRREVASGPLLIAANHVAWWDPLLLVAFDQAVGGGGHCLMDRANLERLPFFRWAGAVPLDRASARGSLRDLGEAARQLDGPGKYLVVFPQGAQTPAHRSLRFKRGVAWLAEMARVPLVPLAIRYDFLEGPRPFVHVSIGASRSIVGSSGHVVRELELAVGAEMSHIDAELERSVTRPDWVRGDEDFVALWAPQRRSQEPSGSRVLGVLAGRKT